MEPSKPFIIKPLEGKDISRVVDLSTKLEEFFPQDALTMIEFSLKEHKAFVGLLDDELVSFLIYEVRDKSTAEILWMGVKKDYHGLGLGTMMLENLEQKLKRDNISNLITTTLSYTVRYKPYEKVRTFFYNRGFKAHGIQNDYYEEGVDRLLLIKELQ